MDKSQLTTMLRERILPEPHVFELTGDGSFKLCNGCSMVIETSADAFKEAKRLLAKYWSITANMREAACVLPLAREGYQIDVTCDCLTVRAAGIDGIRHAFRTLRMLAEPERCVPSLSGTWLLPELHLEDAPALDFRGLHLCVFPENRFTDIAKKIRFAAYLKFNYVVVEFWGTFPFQSHPELCWKEKAHPREQWAELIKEMREQEGVTLIPQFNILGHAPNSRNSTAQHVILNQHPELEPLFEPDGWTWCLSNPHTRKLIEDAICELHEFFGRPPFFHIGCDEADSVGTCSECRRRPVAQLITEHINHFHDVLAKRGTRIMMWHDMLLNRSDRRWAGYTAMAHDYQNMGEAYKALPKDVVIAAWEYGYNLANIPGGPTYPTTKFFNDNGFDTIACAWRMTDVIKSSARLAQNEHLFGLLETTWHIFYGPELQQMFYVTAQSAWGITHHEEYEQTTVPKLWRDIVKDMKLTTYEDLGTSDHQVIPHTFGRLD